MAVTLSDEQAKNAAASLRAGAASQLATADLLDPPTVPNTPPTTPVPPAADLPNFKLIFDEQFTKECAEGQALSVYGDRFFFYPATWDDTSNKGLYEPGIFSISNGIANMRMRTINGRPRVCAPERKINGPSADRNQLYGRYEARFRADASDGYKLRFGSSGPSPGCGRAMARSTSSEGDLQGSIGAFMHRQNGTSGGDQDPYCSSARFLTGTLRSSSGSPTAASYPRRHDDRPLHESSTEYPDALGSSVGNRNQQHVAGGLGGSERAD
jgi:hypothetical protein